MQNIHIDDWIGGGTHIGPQIGDITTQLALWRGGDREALSRLTPLIYEHLRVVAASYVRREDNAGAAAFQPTELVNELFVDLLRMKRVVAGDRNHFFALAARLMRQILIRHARALLAEKRGGKSPLLPLDEELHWSGQEALPQTEALDLNAAMDELEELDESSLRAVELRYFFGFTAEETAQVLDTSKASVDRHVRFGLSWLHSRLRRAAENC